MHFIWAICEHDLDAAWKAGANILVVPTLDSKCLDVLFDGPT
jgi:hypothetical protein